MGRQAGIAGEGEERTYTGDTVHVFSCCYICICFSIKQGSSVLENFFFSLEQPAWYCWGLIYVSEASCAFPLSAKGDRRLLGMMRNNWHVLLSRRLLR